MFEAPVTAVLDANVLYPAPLRDLLMHLAQIGLFRARWTEMIHDEWTRNVLLNNPQLTPERIARTRSLMNAAVRDCIIGEFEPVIDQLELPDPDDRHVLAAAIHGGAELIVTFNMKDFPVQVLSGYQIQAAHPDDFLLSLLELAPELVCEAVKRQRQSLRNPPKSVEELLDVLGNQGLKQSVLRLQNFVEFL